MYLISTEVRPSQIDGVGVFTEVFVRKGTTVWEFDSIFDRAISDNAMKVLPYHVQEYVHRHGYRDKCGMWILDGGNNLYVNYSSKPNVIVDPEWDGGNITAPLIAERDIEPGEELTECYDEYDLRVAFKGVLR
jgi:SET domain-containing protein